MEDTIMPTITNDVGTCMADTVPALESRARRVAQKCGYVARKSRLRRDSVDNRGGFMIIDSRYNVPVAGLHYELTAEDVIEWCQERAPVAP
jgi:hypothetical protein